MKFYSKESMIRSIVVAAGFMLGAMGAQANLVKNPGFELGNPGQVIPDWKIINPGELGGVSNAPYVPFVSPAGGQYFYSEVWTGAYARPNIGGIRQTIDGLTVGKTYQLSFWSTGTDWLVPDEYAFWRVTFGSETQDGTHVTPYENHYIWDVNGVGAGNGYAYIAPQPWVFNTLEFIAGATSQVLQFSQVNFMPNHYPNATPSLLFLDGINLSEVIPTNKVPEPGTASLLALGLLAAGALSKRRKRQA